jgi:hypothetical protein
MSDQAKKTAEILDMMVKMNDRLSKMESLLVSTAEKLQNLEVSTNEKLISLEERLKAVRSPIRTPQKSFEGLGGLTVVTPAMKLTEDAVKDLTRRAGAWVTVEDVAEKTGRSIPLENAYLRTLSKTGLIDRKPIYEGTALNRRVRKYAYSHKT